MVVGEANINNIMGGIANTGVRLHSYKRKLKQRFDIIKKLGQGTYGKVQLGINKETGQEVAIKTIKKSKIETEADLIRIRREIQIMSSVRHPNIVHIYEVFENREKMVLVMEYAAGGELYDYLSERKVLAEEEARRIFRQIAIACYYCHKHKICHRDLKLENILLDENGNAKIADFGLSNVFDDTRLLSTFCGSPLYASPEIVKGTPYHGPEVDCWSLGVLLYTLVYGAMPFDGSNFKRLVKQISQGDYFEPKKPSPASPLIKEMLTVSPRNRADIEKICSHWWVNEGYDESALEISEYLANQTPVRLDYLLSLAPPPPQLESDKLVVTGDVAEESLKAENIAPARSQSVGSLMELSHPAEKRIKDLLSEDMKTPKRKLEVTASMEQVNANRKDKIIKENTVADISVHATIHENASLEDASMCEAAPLDKSRTQTLSKEMDVENVVDESEQGAACAEIIEEAKVKKPLKTNKTNSSLVPIKLEEINENPSQENLCANDKENIEKNAEVKDKEEKMLEESKTTSTKKAKKVLVDKDENKMNDKKEEPKEKVETKEKSEAKEEVKADEMKKDDVENKPLERRRSRIYEQAEKFQNLIAANESKTNVPEKPKKVILPGVSVDGYKKQFERKCSLTSTSPPKAAKCSIPKRISIDKQSTVDKEKSPEKTQPVEERKKDDIKEDSTKSEKVPEKIESKESSAAADRKSQLKNAVSVITNALEKEGARKSKSRPCIRKPPVPFGVGGRSASGSIGMITSPMSPEETTKQLKVQISPNNDTRTATIQVSTPEHIKYDPSEDNKTSSAEITLKSATLPRRKTTKAEIHLNYPQPKPATMEFKTEMAHRIEAPPKLTTQRSEAIFPVAAAPSLAQRSASVEPESKSKPKERIIPICIEKQDEKKQTVSVTSPAATVKPPPTTQKALQNQKSYQSQRSSSLSRQSTQESDTETAASGTGEPIRKSPREYIIPIAVEGGGYVTPRAGSLEPSETGSTTNTMTNSSRRSKFSRNAARRMNSLLSDREGSEDESPFGVHRHSSFGRDSDTEESRKDTFPMHRLRSSRPRKSNLEHTDSMSSGEDDDDDGFDILTAENLFSTLLSRVKDLTQRINVDDRPGFPSSRLLSHFDHGTNFWNFKSRLDPFSRTTPFGRTLSQERSTASPNQAQRPTFGTPWRRSVSRDLASDIESVFNENHTPTQTATLPRGDKPKRDDLNLSDLNLKQLKLSDEDAIALSYLTPGLSRRIQKQLLAQLPPSEAKKLTRTMSMRNSRERTPAADEAAEQKSLPTLPRRCSVENDKIKPTRDLSLPRSKPATISEEYKAYDYSNLPKPCGIYSPESSGLNKFHGPKFNEELSPAEIERSKIPSSTLPRKSRFLRPDFYDKPKEENMAVKEKKEREMETQKVLKEIRDKRKSRLNLRRERSLSRDTSKSESTDATDSKSLDETSRSNGIDTNLNNNNNNNNNNGKERERFGFNENGNNNNKINNEINIKYKPYIENVYGTIPRYININNNNNSKMEKLSLLKRKSFENGNMTEENLKSEDTNRLLNNVSNSIKTLETNINSNHDYVNIAPIEDDRVPKKDVKVSKLIRPKSYPTDTLRSVKAEIKKDPKKDTKIVKPKKIETKESKSEIKELKSEAKDLKSETKESKELRPELKELKPETKDVKQETKGTKEVKNKTPPKTTGEKSNKNRFLQSIEKKIEKLRGLNNGSSRENSVEKKLKEEKEKKSNIENAIKKLREQSLPRSMDRCSTESGLIKRAVSVEDVPTCTGNKELQPSRKSVTKILGLFKKYEEKDKSNKGSKLKKPKEINANEKADIKRNKNDNQDIQDDLKERPKSYYEPPLSKIEETKVKTSKLPINSFRRSLNLENKPKNSKIEENGNTDNLTNDVNDNFSHKPDRKNLKLDLSRPMEIPDPIPSTSSENRNSTATDDSSLFLSPCDDNMSCDSWSICSDYHTHDLTSPVSVNGNIYSGDEGESVIDRIRRKSFYTRFNEKKKPRKPSISGSYRDLDLYKDYSQRKSYARSPGDYSSLDRRSVDYRFPVERRLSYGSQESPVKREYRPYARSSSLLNDYVNVPHRYQTYNPRLTKHISSLYSPDTEDDTVDDLLSAGKTRINSYHYQPTRLNGRASSISPSIDKL